MFILNLSFICKKVLLVIVATVAAAGCNQKPSGPGGGGDTLAISGLAPTSGPSGTAVTIHGSNFSSIASANMVTFGGSEATVTTVVSDSLLAVVPEGLSPGSVSVEVTTGGQTASGPDFEVTNQPAPKVDVCSDMDQAWIFCDDFESDQSLSERYFEYGNDDGDFVPVEGKGRGGGAAMRALYQKGETDAGSIKKSFGRTPSSYIGTHAAEPNKDFNEIYWRMDIRYESDWTGGGGAKLCRAIVFATSNWAEGAMAHLWSAGPGNKYLVMDPASGIDEAGNLQATKYNDFDNLRWLGAKRGEIPLFSSDNVGQWYSVEAHVKLNTPGKSDGVFEFWINGQKQVGSYNLNWHGDWNADPDHYMINAILISNYWNEGSVATQKRYIDNFIISTQRIGEIRQ